MNEVEVDSDKFSNDYHPSYSCPSTDIVLLSDDEVRFRVHSSILATASKFFHDMFRMPRLAAEHHDDALPMEEPSEIIKTLLDIIYPRATDPVLPFVSFAFVRRLLRAAEKYDLERVHHYVRLLTLTRPFLSKPLEVYSLACMFGWAEDAHRISFQTLNLDLSSPVHADILESLDSASLYKLFQVRWRIKEEVTEAMEMLKRRHENEEWGCDCGSNLLDDEEWDCLHRLIRGEFG